MLFLFYLIQELQQQQQNVVPQQQQPAQQPSPPFQLSEAPQQAVVAEKSSTAHPTPQPSHTNKFPISRHSKKEQDV